MMINVFQKILKSIFLSENEQTKEILEKQASLQKQLDYIMASLTNLQDAITRLSSITDEAVKVLNTPHIRLDCPSLNSIMFMPKA